MSATPPSNVYLDLEAHRDIPESRPRRELSVVGEAISTRLPNRDPAVEPPLLLDERSRPDLRHLYGQLAARARLLDAAVGRIRLGGMNLNRPELGGIERIRIVLAEINALTLAAEGESMAAEPARRERLELLEHLLASGKLRVRMAALAGWSPDFSVFTHQEDREEPTGRRAPLPARVSGGLRTAVLGPHWFERPYPHPGPAFAAVVGGEAADRVSRRFDALWDRGHDISDPVASLIRGSLRRVRQAPGPELTPFEPSGYS